MISRLPDYKRSYHKGNRETCFTGYSLAYTLPRMTLQSRLLRARKAAKKSQKAVSDAVGISQPAYSDLELGKSSSSSYLVQIANVLGVDPLWLATGEGEPAGRGEMRAEEHSQYLEIPAFLRRGETTDVTPGPGDAAPTVAPGPAIKGRIPLISWVQAGDWCEAIDNFAPGDADEWLPCPFDHGENAFCLEVVGQSMSPDYREGEIIAVDPAVEPRHGDDIVCRTSDGRVTFKRLQITPDGTYLLALNPEWPNRMIEIPAETRTCGVVIGSWMRRRR